MENNLPQGWAECSLGDVCSKPQYGWTSKAGNSGQIKYLRTTDISNGNLNWEKVPYCIELPNEIEKYQVKRNDILVSRAGSVGFNFRIKEDVPFNAVFASYLIRFKAYDDITARFIDYFLESENYWRQISDFTAGIAIPNVNATKLEELLIPLPPLAEQHRIVAKLDAVMQKVESNKQHLEKIPKLLKRFRQSVLAVAVSGKLTEDWRGKNGKIQSAEGLLNIIQEFRNDWAKKEIKKGNSEAKRIISKLSKHTFNNLTDQIPETWCYSSLLKACHLVIDCHNKTAPYVDEGIYLVRTTNIKEGKLIFDDIRYVTQKTYEYWSRRCLPAEGDIVFTREAPMGEATIIPKGIKICLGQRTMLLRMPKDLLFNQYVLYCLISPKMIEQINDKAIGSGVKHLRVGDVESLVFPLPPLEEQKEIVRRVEQLFAFADKIEARYTKAKAMLDKLPQSILAKAFRGKLVPQNPNDEPASVLLARVKAEKEKSAKEKKKKKD